MSIFCNPTFLQNGILINYDYKYCMYLGGHKSGVADRTLGVGGGEAVAA